MKDKEDKEPYKKFKIYFSDHERGVIGDEEEKVSITVNKKKEIE
jgi:hypothetical protein